MWTKAVGGLRGGFYADFYWTADDVTLFAMSGGNFSALRMLLERSRQDEQRVAAAPATADVVSNVQRHVSRVPERKERRDDWPAWADAQLVAGWQELGVAQPWEHQAAAANQAFAGQTTLLATATGSGKSLGYWLPALTAARLPRGKGYGTSLYLAPTKALAGDQLQAARTILNAANITDVAITTVDGDTDFEQRRWAQSQAQIVLTNPDMLHHALLPAHPRWRRLLKNLRFVIVDEAHAYRGVFGAHVAAVLRRLLRLASHYGSAPTTILASATTADPQLSAARLIGGSPKEVKIIADDASPRGEQTLLLWEPAPLPADEPDAHWVARTATNEAAHVLADLVAQGVRTLVFARSRSGAENIAEIARSLVLDRTGSTELAQRIATYRGGYLPEERRQLEKDLRDGVILGMASTNALELGVDISGLDAVLIAGWPGTRVSIRQQSGRAGRAGAPGVAVFISRDDPLDSFLVHHPRALLDAPLEATTFDPTNPYVLAPHLCAAAAELPLTADDLARFTAPGSSVTGVERVVELLVQQGALRRRSTGWYWTRRERASDLTSLRGASGTVTIVAADSGEVIGTIDAAAADAQVHTGAVYIHQGETYLVDEYRPSDAVALGRTTHVPYWTLSLSQTDIHVLVEERHQDWGPVTWHLGTVEVTNQVTEFQQRRRQDGLLLDTKPLDLPERTLTTTACWWTVPQRVLDAAGIAPDEVAGALHAAEHASIGMLPLLATCDRWDIGGVASAQHRDTQSATVFVHDGLPGGSGFANRGFELATDWIRATFEAISTCPCNLGCPSCIQSPKCGSNNSPLNKDAALRLLEELLRHAPVSAITNVAAANPAPSDPPDQPAPPR